MKSEEEDIEQEIKDEEISESEEEESEPEIDYEEIEQAIDDAITAEVDSMMRSRRSRRFCYLCNGGEGSNIICMMCTADESPVSHTLEP